MQFCNRDDCLHALLQLILQPKPNFNELNPDTQSSTKRKKRTHAQHAVREHQVKRATNDNMNDPHNIYTHTIMNHSDEFGIKTEGTVGIKAKKKTTPAKDIPHNEILNC